MEFKDYYATLGLERSATPDDIKRAYRKLARKYHPDVSKEADAEARFKDVAEAYAVLSDTEKRAAYDDIGRRGAAPQGAQDFNPPPGWDSGFEFSGRDFGDGAGTEHSDFFEALFGRHARTGRGPRGTPDAAGGDHHAKVTITLADAYRGARRTITLRMPVLGSDGSTTLQERQIEISIPKGIREGQHLRLAGQGAPGLGGGPAGDLYLEIAFQPHTNFRVDGRDVYLDLPVSPWEAALGASITVPTPTDPVTLTVPPDSAPGRKLRLKGKGLPADPPGDLYVVLRIALPAADAPAAKEAYAAFARSFPDFNARRTLEA
ncbi:MAG: DnaJ C-terminal domain-containing protein [Rhizobacter sp.]